MDLGNQFTRSHSPSNLALLDRYSSQMLCIALYCFLSLKRHAINMNQQKLVTPVCCVLLQTFSSVRRDVTWSSSLNFLAKRSTSCTNWRNVFTALTRQILKRINFEGTLPNQHKARSATKLQESVTKPQYGQQTLSGLILPTNWPHSILPILRCCTS